MLAARARALGDGQGHDAEDEGQGGHQDRPQSDAHRLQRGVDERATLLLQILGELDDQDGVLGRQAHGRQQADLEVDVVGQAADHGGQHRADDTQRNDQDHRQGDAPALVQGGQQQEDHDDRQGVQRRRLGARLAFLLRQAGPFVANARRQLGGQAFHGVHGVAGALALGRRALDVHGRQAIVALEPGRADGPAGGGEGREGRHLAVRAADVPPLKVFGAHAEGRVGLYIDLLDPAPVDEVVDVETAERGAEGAVDVGGRDALGAGPGLVDVDAELGRVVLAVGAHAGQVRVLAGHAQQLVAGGHQGVVADAADVFQFEVEARGVAQLRYGGRCDGEDHGVADLGEGAHGPAGDGLGRL